MQALSEQLELERERELQRRQCELCMERNRDCTMGCGHQTCMVCSLALVECPVCRHPIECRVRTYM